MMDKQSLTAAETANTERMERGDSGYIRVGDWYWHHGDDGKSEDPKLMCVMKVGTNFVEVHSPRLGNGYTYDRILLKDIHKHLTFEPDATRIIAGKVAGLKVTLDQTLEEVRELTHDLGLPDSSRIADGTASPEGESRELAVMNGTQDVNDHKKRLAEARETTLPELFKKIQSTTESMASWMKAESMPFLSEADGLKAHLKNIDDRIFNISLYAGLLETMVQCRDGKPADMGTKLNVMQRRLYMDEECLLNYTAGGMEFADVEEFDEWLARDENFHRVLPFDRCIVAMKVRRKPKDRGPSENLLDLFIKMNLEAADKNTFLYIRNGDRLYRLNTDVDFGEKIFPSRDQFDPSEPLMMNLFANRVDGFMTVREFEAIEEADKREKEQRAQWFTDNPFDEWAREELLKDDAKAREGRLRWEWEHSNPFRQRSSHPRGDWEPFDQNSVYYDDAVLKILDKMREYNRIALIIQGILDRTDALAPHTKIRTWQPEEFSAHIELIYDADEGLNNGEEPDIQAYIDRCNESLGRGSVVTGQQLYWMEKEADKENRRRDNDWRSSQRPGLDVYAPYGNPGPGDIARIASWSKTQRKAGFKWFRDRMSYRHDQSDHVAASLSVPADRLFNMDAYQPGDFMQFFADHRTRAKYLKWAPILLRAEDYKAGRAKVVEPETKAR